MTVSDFKKDFIFFFVICLVPILTQLPESDFCYININKVAITLTAVIVFILAALKRITWLSATLISSVFITYCYPIPNFVNAERIIISVILISFLALLIRSAIKRETSWFSVLTTIFIIFIIPAACYIVNNIAAGRNLGTSC